ncbi:MAG: SRPBCC family protein [Actinomycetota bacterium]|nr:SRPBCC family protein [Actinomycetota bacterium]
MKSTTITRTFPMTQKACWDLITNIVDYPRLIDSYEAVEVTTETHEGQGARWKQTRKVFGRSHSQDLEIIEWDPDRSLTHEAHEGGTTYQTRYVMSPSESGEGTSVEMTFTVEANGVFGRMVLAAFGERLVRSTGVQMDRDLADLSKSAIT